MRWDGVRWGKVMWGNVRVGEVRWGEVKWGQVRSGEGRWGEVMWGQVRVGEVRWCEVMWGQVRVVDVRWCALKSRVCCNQVPFFEIDECCVLWSISVMYCDWWMSFGVTEECCGALQYSGIFSVIWLGALEVKFNEII